MAPGINRKFAFMGWPAFREGQWAFFKREAQGLAKGLDRPLIFASDIDLGACERLAATIAGNGMADAVRVAPQDVFQCEGHQYGGGPGLVAINPPYGIRLGSAEQADELLLDEGRKEHLPVEEVAEALAVGGHEPVHERRAAACVPDDEDRRDHPLSPQRRKEQVVEQEEEVLDQGEQGFEQQQPENHGSAPRPVLLGPGERQHLPVDVRVEIHALSSTSRLLQLSAR